MFNKSKTWEQNIMEVMSDKKWKSHRQIFKALGLKFQDDPNKVQVLCSYLLRLLRSGYIMRAHAPDFLKELRKPNRVMYVYKWTGKPYS